MTLDCALWMQHNVFSFIKGIESTFEWHRMVITIVYSISQPIRPIYHMYTNINQVMQLIIQLFPDLNRIIEYFSIRKCQIKGVKALFDW